MSDYESQEHYEYEMDMQAMAEAEAQARENEALAQAELDEVNNAGITCYSEMNKKIIELLRMRGDDMSLYAAQRIEDLEGLWHAVSQEG